MKLPDTWDDVRTLLDGCINEAEHALFVAIKRNRGPAGRDALLAQIDALETVRGELHARIDAAAGGADQRHVG
jgi:hypothetical protein